MLAGLLGGAVYVNAFTLLSREVEPRLREFSLAAASLADSVGIALADICGVLIQVYCHLSYLRILRLCITVDGSTRHRCRDWHLLDDAHQLNMLSLYRLLPQFSGVFRCMQGCLFKANGLSGADFTC